ncbi:NADH-quinone oxidoreductase subunit NuoN [Millisia brevis]|uniref:NADH-quinone oxidoreductase subunit NuoN n=1 Tax=Millisia brevis TaxID=264148 RepID=UPI00082DC456|nr:NADH-quinone oxidoreductase subunit NuoN [Millisia brevis]
MTGTTSLLAAPLPAPSIEYGRLAPVLIVLGVAVAGVVIEAFAPAARRWLLQVSLAVAGLVAAAVAVVLLAGRVASFPDGGVSMVGSMIVDGTTLALQGIVLAVALPAILLVAERRVEVTADGIPADAFAARASTIPGSVAERQATRAGVTQTEVFPLTMFAVGGMLIMPASGDLLTMFIALEVLSLPLYLLCGMARRRRLMSQEASLKYFLLGAFASAFFLFGVALLYGYAGTSDLADIAAAIDADTGSRALAVTGAALLVAGLLFKIGAVPLHAWIPDVYQGAPTPITAFMAAATKIAAVGALLRVLTTALPDLTDSLRPMLWAVVILTMVVGSVAAISQTNVKRMLAYSAVAHAGFMLTGLAAAGALAPSATIFYLFAYGMSTLGAFAIVTLVRTSRGEADDLSSWAGLGKRSPLVAAMFALLLLSFAGIPLTSGFIAKFAVFRAAAEAGGGALVVVGVVCSAIAAAFYVRVIVLMFFTDAGEDPAVVTNPSALTKIAVAVCTALTIVLGLAPQWALDLANRAAELLT